MARSIHHSIDCVSSPMQTHKGEIMNMGRRSFARAWLNQEIGMLWNSARTLSRFVQEVMCVINAFAVRITGEAFCTKINWTVFEFRASLNILRRGQDQGWEHSAGRQDQEGSKHEIESCQKCFSKRIPDIAFCMKLKEIQTQEIPNFEIVQHDWRAISGTCGLQWFPGCRSLNREFALKHRDAPWGTIPDSMTGVHSSQCTFEKHNPASWVWLYVSVAVERTSADIYATASPFPFAIRICRTHLLLQHSEATSCVQCRDRISSKLLLKIDYFLHFLLIFDPVGH